MTVPLEDFGPDWLVKRLRKESGKDYMLILPYSLSYEGRSYYITVDTNTDKARVNCESGKAIPEKIRREIFKRAMELERWEHFLSEHSDLDDSSLVGEWQEIADVLSALKKSAERLTAAQRETLASLIKQFHSLAKQDPSAQVGKVIREHDDQLAGMVGNEAGEKEWRRLLKGYHETCEILKKHQCQAEPVLQACRKWLKEVQDQFPARRWWTFLRYQRCVKEVRSSGKSLSSTLEQLLFKEPYTLTK